jgi:phosphoglycolate phosphatase
MQAAEPFMKHSLETTSRLAGAELIMLFLFDIDGTLLRGMPPAHRLAICDAARRIFAVSLAPMDLGLTAGMTDTSIILRVLEEAGVPRKVIQAGLPEFFIAAGEAYEGHVPPDLRPYHTPHARAALERLREAGVCLGLVTGNIQRIAWVKLRAAELAEYFADGGFGDEAAEREQLPPLAIARLEKYYQRTFLPAQVVVVGDTPQDVACGKAWGLATVAVATGPAHSDVELRAAGADYVCDDLSGLATLELGSL